MRSKEKFWLSKAKLELPAISRICLAGRISTIEKLKQEIKTIIKEQNELKIKTKWQFIVIQTRDKLNRHYEKIKSKT